MTDAASIVDRIQKLRDELKELANTVPNQEGLRRGRDRHERWKARASKFLRDHVSPDEAERLARIRGSVSIRRDATGNFRRQCQADDSFLETLAEEIKNHPEMVIRSAGAPDWALMRAPEALREAAERLRFHPRVVEAARCNFEAGLYRQAVAEVGTAILSRLKELSGVNDKDGAKLVSAALFGDQPRVAVNPLKTQSEKDEQTGLAHLAQGYTIGLRNPCSHDQQWPVDQVDALKALVVASLIMEKLDKAEQTSTT